MESNITNIATELRNAILSNDKKAGDKLIEFAERYSINRTFAYQSYIYKINLNSYSDEKLTEIQKETCSLIDKITDDYQTNRNDEDYLKTIEHQQKIEDYYKKQPIKEDIVFQSDKASVFYPKFSLTDISLQLRLGEITAVVGRNGHGKTTLFKLICGIVSQSKGKISFPHISNSLQDKFSIYNRIAYVPQEIPKWNDSLKNTLHFEAAFHGIKGKENEKAVNFIIHRLDLQNHIDKKWSELSGGYKLRFELAKALVWRPSLLVIDEPLANLDINTQQLILNDLRYLADSYKYPMSVIISSQHLTQIEYIADKILYLKNGKIGFYGKVDELNENRNSNIFEFTCKTQNINELKQLLSDFEYNDLFFNGLNFTIVTPIQITRQQTLKAFTERNIDFTSFDDISQSIIKEMKEV